MFGYDALRAEQTAAPRLAATRSSSASASRRSPRCAASRPSRVLGSLDYGAGGWEHASVRMLPTGKVEVVTGASRARPGPRDGVQPDRRRPARRAVRGRRGPARRHPGRAQGPGHLRLALAGRRRRGAGQGRRQGDREGQADRGAPARGHRSTTSSSPAAGSRSRAPTRAWRSAEVALATFAAHNLPDGHGAAHRRRGDVRPGRTSPSRTARTCARWRSTPRPARSTMRKYVCVDDIGNIINPLIVDGPGARRPRAGHRPGAVGGGGLRRRRHAGDRLVRRLPAADARPTRSASTSTTRRRPSTTNTLGTKGVGEAGTIASTPAVVNAVVDAVRHFGVNDIQMPCTPERVWRAIQALDGDGATETPAMPHFEAGRTQTSTKEQASDPRTVRLRGADHRSRRPWPRSPSTATTPRSSPAGRACCRCCGCGSTHPRWSSTSAGSTALRGIRDDGDAHRHRRDDHAPRRPRRRRWSREHALLLAKAAADGGRPAGPAPRHLRRRAGARRPGRRPGRAGAGAGRRVRDRRARAAPARSRPTTSSSTSSRPRSARTRSSPRSGSRSTPAGAPTTRSSSASPTSGRSWRSPRRCGSRAAPSPRRGSG